MQCGAGELVSLVENMSTKKRISVSCCIKTCMSTNLDEKKKNFYSIPSPNRYRQKHDRWVAAIKVINGAEWEPKTFDKVCSSHCSKGTHSQIQCSKHSEINA